MSEGVCRSTRAGREQNDTPPDVRLARHAAEHHGVVCIHRLRDLGLDDDAVARRVRSGRLHRVHRGVYAVGHPGLTLTGRFVAAVLACGGRAALSHFAAAAYWGFLPWEERDIDVTIVGTSARSVPGVRVRRARSLHERDVWRRDAMRVISPARTLLDLAAVLPDRALRRAARQAQAEHRVNIRRLAETLRRCNGHHGVAALSAIVTDGPAPTRSDLEDLLLDLLDDAGIERPEINPRLHLDGRPIRPDYLWRDRRVAIEADSRRWHDLRLVRENDADKQAILEAHDFRVVRVSGDQLATRPQQTLARIRSALAG